MSIITDLERQSSNIKLTLGGSSSTDTGGATVPVEWLNELAAAVGNLNNGMGNVIIAVSELQAAVLK
jgi:hypothetical protein